MNKIDRLPKEYTNTPIEKLLKNYSGGLANPLIEVLGQISVDEFQRVCTWAHISEKAIEQIAENPTRFSDLITRCLSIFINAVQIKKKFEERYPESKIDYIEYDGTALHGDPRHWLIVDGMDGKEFEEFKANFLI